MSSPIQRIAIVDGGLAAVRAIRAIDEYNDEQKANLCTIALFTPSNQQALFVQEADESFPLGSDYEKSEDALKAIERAILSCKADAVWGGWTSPKADLANLCQKLGVTYIGANSDAIERASNKEALLELVQKTEITVSAKESRQSLSVQIAADRESTIWVINTIDKMQFGETALLMESPSSAITNEDEIAEISRKVIKTLELHGLATVVFTLYNSSIQDLAVYPGLESDHTVSESRSGLDLFKLELSLALGGCLEGEAPKPVSPYTFGVGFCASKIESDATNGCKIESLRIPSGLGLRAEVGFGEGEPLLANSPLLIAVLTANGQKRREALARLKRAVQSSTLVIHGYKTNKSLLLNGISYLEAESGDPTLVDPIYAKAALIQAAIEVYLSDFALEQARFVTSASRGRPQVRREAGLKVELGYQGQVYLLTVYRLEPQTYRVDVDGKQIVINLAWSSSFERRLVIAGRSFHTSSLVTQPNFNIEVEGIEYQITREDFGVVRSPTPAVVVSVDVKEGDAVKAGDVIAVVESMKLELTIAAPYSGKVRRVLVLPNVQVDVGAPLIQMELINHSNAPTDTVRLSFSELSTPSATSFEQQCYLNFKAFQSLLLGYDIEATAVKQLIAERGKLCQQLPVGDQLLLEHEDELLATFVDLSSLFQRQLIPEDQETAETLASHEYLLTYMRTFDPNNSALPTTFINRLLRALARYNVTSLRRCPELEEALMRIYKSHFNIDHQTTLILSLLERRLAHHQDLESKVGESFLWLLNKTIEETQGIYPAISELAREVRFRYYDESVFELVRKRVYEQVEEHLTYLENYPAADDRQERIRELVDCPQPLAGYLSKRYKELTLSMQQLLLEILTRRYYRIRNLESFNNLIGKHHIFVTAHYTHPIDGIDIHVASTFAEYSHLAEAGEELSYLVKSFPQEHDTVIDIYIWSPEKREIETVREEIQAELNRTAFPRPIRRIVVSVAGIETIKGMEGMWHFTFRHTAEGYQEEKVYRGLHPMMGKRLHLWRLVNFNIERLPSVEDVYLFKVNAKENPKDERVFAIAEVRDMTVIRDKDGKIAQIPYLEHMLFEAAASIRQVLSQRPPKERPQWNRLLLYIWPTFDFNDDELNQIALKLSSATEGLGLERIVIRCKLPDEHTGSLKDTILRISNPGGLQPVVSFHAPADHPLRPLSEYERKVQQLRRRGLLSPYEIVEMLTSSRGEKLQFPPGEFTEYDLNEQNQLVPVSRPYGLNRANLVVGVIRNFTTKYPEGMARVVMLGDPSKGMGSIAEAECRRIMACIDLAAELKLPLEWFPVSAGAKISMESGTENMDWIAAVLRELIKFTQAGGEINIVVNGINVGAQPYWNAESTMLMHTRGILIMTPEGAMVLTGKRALDFSGSVSADDNFGIGGYDRVMGQNGQAQYWAENIVEACEILLRHYDHTYVVPGERFPRDSSTSDSKDRDIRSYPYNASKADGFTVVGEIFTEEHNAGRKRPFDIRSVMRAVIDQDHQPLERWAGFRDAEIPVVWDAHLGGHPVCLIGMESHPLPRLGFISADGPYQWTAGTLFPSGSKKVARTINSVSGNRPLVVLANLSGFDGSPESMRKWQLEFGAEIGRAVVNFKGPMVFCVVSRYHGGAYVVFSKTLNEQLEVAALEGSFASVIGGAPAAAVVFAGDVEKRTREDERLVALEKAIAAAEGAEKGRLRAEYNELTNIVYSEKLGQVAEEFDTIHSIHRALQVGSLDRIISSSNLRPYLIDAVERGIQRTLEKEKK